MEGLRDLNTANHKLCVRLVPIFNHLDDDTMKKIASYTHHVDLEKGEFLYQAGDEGNALYIVHRGRIKIYRLLENGKEQLVRLLNPGDFTGEWTLFQEEGVQRDFAEASIKTEICMLRREDMQKILADYPSIGMELLSKMSQRLEQSERQTTTVAVGQIASRIAMFLADLVEDDKSEEQTVVLPMNRRELASYLGTTPESITRNFNKLEEAGLIHSITSKKIHINNLTNLLLYSD